jgi:hypothetical protein
MRKAAKRRCEVGLLRGVGVEDDFYFPPSSYASFGLIAAAAEPDTNRFTDLRALFR